MWLPVQRFREAKTWVAISNRHWTQGIAIGEAGIEPISGVGIQADPRGTKTGTPTRQLGATRNPPFYVLVLKPPYTREEVGRDIYFPNEVVSGARIPAHEASAVGQPLGRRPAGYVKWPPILHLD